MKRLTLLIVCITLAIQSFADRQKTIEIYANAEPTEVEFDACRALVSATATPGQSDVRITVEMENSCNNDLFLFGHAYMESQLKKNKPSIRFDKAYGSNDRQIKVCKGLEDEGILQIEPRQHRIMTFRGQSNAAIDCEFPLYVAIHRQKKFLSKEKYLITQREITLLTVTVKGDAPQAKEELKELEDEYEQLLDDLDNLEQKFCPNRRHTPSLQEQEEPFKRRISELKEKIKEIKEENRWTERSPKYKRYKELLAQVNEIDLNQYERDCGKHTKPVPSHSCGFDNWSPNKAFTEITQIFRNMDNGRISKDEAIRQANNIMNCPVLKRKIDNDASIKRKIEEYLRVINE